MESLRFCSWKIFRFLSQAITADLHTAKGKASIKDPIFIKNTIVL